jgi:hypothetical protein
MPQVISRHSLRKLTEEKDKKLQEEQLQEHEPEPNEESVSAQPEEEKK